MSKYNRTPEERETIKRLTKNLILEGKTLSEIVSITGYTAAPINAIANELGVVLKLKPDNICKVCNSSFQSKSKTKDICSDACRIEQIRLDSIKKQTDPYTYCECGICGYRSPDLKIHILKIHEITNDTYREITGQTDLTSVNRKAKDSERIKGSKNPGFQHDGKLSPYSKNFVKGYDEDKHSSYIQATKERHKNHPELNPFLREYYDSDQEYSIAQTRDLSWFINKYGKEEGVKRHTSKIEKWISTLESKSEEEKEEINKRKASGLGYKSSRAELEILELIKNLGIDDCEGQFRIQFGRYQKAYDVRLGNKLIEYNGSFQHADPRFYDENFYNPVSKSTAKQIQERDKEKKELAESLGYEVYTIQESDYHSNKEKVLQECINFLTQ